MREVIIILIIVVSVIALGVCEQKYIDNNTNELISNLNEIKKQVKEQKHEAAIKKTNELSEKWDKIEGKLSILVDHEHIDNVGESIGALKTGLEADEKEGITKEIDKTIFLLNDIQDINRLKWKNVF